MIFKFYPRLDHAHCYAGCSLCQYGEMVWKHFRGMNIVDNKLVFDYRFIIRMLSVDFLISTNGSNSSFSISCLKATLWGIMEF